MFGGKWPIFHNEIKWRLPPLLIICIELSVFGLGLMDRHYKRYEPSVLTNGQAQALGTQKFNSGV